MKKILVIILVTFLYSCGHDKTFYLKDGRVIEATTIGVLNDNSSRCDSVIYEPSIGNVVWSIILCETIVMPVYFVGWSIQNPVKYKNPNNECTEEEYEQLYRKE